MVLNNIVRSSPVKQIHNMPAVLDTSSHGDSLSTKTVISPSLVGGPHPLKSVAEDAVKQRKGSVEDAGKMKQLLSDEENRPDREICERLTEDMTKGLNQATPLDLDDMCNNALRVQVEYHDEARAIELYEEVVKLDGKHVRALSCLGALYHKSGRLNEARKCYENVLQMEPDRYKTVYNLGRLAHDVGSYADAQKCYQRTLGLKSDDTIACNALAFLGLLHQEVHKDFEQAKRCYASSLDRNPNHVRTLDHQCALMMLTGDREGARVQHQRIVKLDPGHSDTMCAYLNALFNGELLPAKTETCACTSAAAMMDHNSWHGTASAPAYSITKPNPVQRSTSHASFGKEKSHSFLGRVASKLKHMTEKRDSFEGARSRVGSFPYKLGTSKSERALHGSCRDLDSTTHSVGF